MKTVLIFISLIFQINASLGSEMDKEKFDRLDRIMKAHDPIEKLKRRLDFDNKIASDNRKIIVQYDWANLSKEDGFKKFNIKNMKIYEAGEIYSGAYEFLQHFFDGEFDYYPAHVLVTQTPNIKKSSEYFIRKVSTSSNRLDIPYEPSGIDIGTVTLQGSGEAPNRQYIWIYKNIYFHVDCESPEAALALSKILQSLAEKHVVQIAD